MEFLLNFLLKMTHPPPDIFKNFLPSLRTSPYGHRDQSNQKGWTVPVLEF